ncbi:hypothetical protein EJ06DRAFT_528302 [Trichodelitschia bisporula]|uniref:Uncharacterized protein n=1 Tax=Trichodelitschia bisporula TaxID=703511 RepID=A0A6G1I1P3_9PEZI|nr:hypothetical protein EJ06DRAFT_528302 [Trichodelitschia bisporula]
MLPPRSASAPPPHQRARAPVPRLEATPRMTNRCGETSLPLHPSSSTLGPAGGIGGTVRRAR